jgi:hypothetical protein
MRKLRLVVLILLLGCALFLLSSGSFLVINAPQRSDVIVVLAGETDRRPARALELLSQHFAPRVLLNVPADTKIYGITALDLAQQYVNHLPERDSVTICPIIGLSTKAESHDASRCLKQWDIHKVLLVTSDYHTRRALSTFRHELPDYQFSVAAAYDPEQFGTKWWQHRQWAKLNFSEWFRLVWWEAVDRWHQ